MLTVTSDKVPLKTSAYPVNMKLITIYQFMMKFIQLKKFSRKRQLNLCCFL